MTSSIFLRFCNFGAASVLLTVAASANAATLISEVVVPGAGSGSIVSNSTDPGFSPVLNQNVTAGGVAITSSINLTSGSLRGTVNSVGSQRGGYFNLNATEQFNFTIPGALASTVTSIGFRQFFGADLAVTGASSVTLQSTIFSPFNVMSAFVGLTSGDFRPFYAYGNGYNFPDLPVSRGGLGELSGRFDHVTWFNVTGPNPELLLSITVQAIAASNSWLNFGNSAHVGFVLPDGVSFSSPSGIALTQGAFPGTGVPEPASWAMLIAGFGLVGAALRRRRTLAAG